MSLVLLFGEYVQPPQDGTLALYARAAASKAVNATGAAALMARATGAAPVQRITGG